MKYLYYIIFSLIFSSINCYTIVEKKSFVKRNYLIYSNHKLIGAWITKSSGNKYVYHIKKLEFFMDGDVTFYPSLNRNNLKFYTGKFRVQKDTLTIRLFNNPFEENFIFSVNNSHMILEKINSTHREICQISGIDTEYWRKAIF